MSNKTVNWDAYAKNAVNPKRGTFSSFQDYLRKATSRQRTAESAEDIFKATAPILKQRLLEKMVTRQPIVVTKPITIFVDKIEKSKSGRPQFVSGTEVLKVGTELTFVKTIPTLGKWLFKSAEGTEYEIYDSPHIMVEANSVAQNPGYFGLLLNTNVFDEVMQELKGETDEEA